MSWSTIGTLLVIVAGFAICATAFGFFKAAFAQRKIDKEAEQQKQAEKEKEEAEKISKSKKQKPNKNKPKVKRLGEAQNWGEAQDQKSDKS